MEKKITVDTEQPLYIYHRTYNYKESWQNTITSVLFFSFIFAVLSWLVMHAILFFIPVGHSLHFIWHFLAWFLILLHANYKNRGQLLQDPDKRAERKLFITISKEGVFLHGDAEHKGLLLRWNDIEEIDDVQIVLNTKWKQEDIRQLFEQNLAYYELQDHWLLLDPLYESELTRREITECMRPYFFKYRSL